MIASDVATREGIDNTPSFEIVRNLEELCDNLLQPMREAWGAPINVTSGYRCKELNKKVGGVSMSAHTLGYACDLQTKNFSKFVEFATKWLKDKAFDQCIIEKSGNTTWLHLGIRNNKGEQRRQFLNITKK